jgi:hypothetical protein
VSCCQRQLCFFVKGGLNRELLFGPEYIEFAIRDGVAKDKKSFQEEKSVRTPVIQVGYLEGEMNVKVNDSALLFRT